MAIPSCRLELRGGLFRSNKVSGFELGIMFATRSHMKYQ